MLSLRIHAAIELFVRGIPLFLKKEIYYKATKKKIYYKVQINTMVINKIIVKISLQARPHLSITQVKI
jgi:hypothetical protein